MLTILPRPRYIVSELMPSERWPWPE
jgi:hypothetical protein